jgi:Lamin Tail Domain/LGFP repeat
MAASDVSIRRVMVNPPGLDVDHEAVVLHNGGAEDVELTGWRLSDTLNHPGPTFTFTFPTFTLLSGSDVTVHTGAGANNGQHLFWECTEAVWNNRGARATLFDGTRGRDRPDPVAPLQHGRVINTTQIAQDIAAAGPVAGVSQPSSPVKWTLGSNGGEIFWREFGPTGAAFHSGSPTPQPPGTPVPEAPVLKMQDSIYRKFVDLGGVPALGRPLSRRREVPVADPNRQALRQDFDGGAILRSPETGAHLVKGPSGPST